MNAKALLVTFALALFAPTFAREASAQDIVLPLDLSGTRPALSISIGAPARRPA